MRTATLLDIKHHTLCIGEEEMVNDLEDATYHCEHHNMNLNFVGKFALSRLPREHGYPVVLTGEGADEQFAGYPMYVPDILKETDHAWPHRSLPERERMRLLQNQEDDLMRYLHGRGAEDYRTCLPEVVAYELNNIVTATTMTSYQLSPDLWADWTTDQGARIPDPLVTMANGIPVRVKQKMQQVWHPLHSGLYVWSKCHLANSILSCLGDRTEMAHSIEARTPFLDHELTEYANGLPPSVKLRYDSTAERFTEKWILREATRPFISKELYERKKHAYTAPVLYPKNGPLHQRYKTLFTNENIKNLGFLEWERVKGLMERAFVGRELKAMRNLNLCCQWILLGKRFGIARAGPLGPVDRAYTGSPH